MGKLLRKRAFRDFKTHLSCYFALVFMITISIYLVVSLMGSSLTIMEGVDAHAFANHVEDGEFETFVPLTDQQLEELSKQEFVIEPQFFQDFQLKNSTVRIFSLRQNINLLEIDPGGQIPGSTKEVVMEKQYAQKNHYKIGDSLQIAGQTFTIVGTGSVPDYDCPSKVQGDTSVDSHIFGLAFVTPAAYQQLTESNQGIGVETYIYAYRLLKNGDEKDLKSALEKIYYEPKKVKDPYFREYWNRMTKDSEALKELLSIPFLMKENDAKEIQEKIDEQLNSNLQNLRTFLTADKNLRIKASSNDLKINWYSTLVITVIVLFLFAYVMSVFTMHQIDKESAMIGSLYALGMRHKTLLHHYAFLPTLLSFVGGLIGTIIGYSPLGVPVQMQDSYSYYSIPVIAPQIHAIVLIYGILLPPLMAYWANYLFLSKKLKLPPLRLLRKERVVKNLHHTLPLSHLSFIQRFRIREFRREFREACTILISLYICMLLVFIGIDCQLICRHLYEDQKKDTKFSYMYLYKYPDKTVPEGGEGALALPLKKSTYGYDFDVALLGISPKNTYFDVQVHPGEKEVSISSSMAQKFHLKKGDLFTMEDKEHGRYYSFYIHEIVPYSTSFYVFMDLSSMQKMLHVPDDSYNIVFSDHPLPIEKGKLYSTTSRENIEKSASIFIDLIRDLVYTTIIMGILIFCIVLYLMLSVSIEHAGYDIATLKLFGYRSKEIRRLYLSGQFIILMIGTVIFLPLSKRTIDAMYPSFISNVAMGINLSMPMYYYLILYFAIILFIGMIMILLRKKIDRISPTEIIKNRE